MRRNKVRRRPAHRAAVTATERCRRSFDVFWVVDEELPACGGEAVAVCEEHHGTFNTDDATGLMGEEPGEAVSPHGRMMTSGVDG